MPESEVLIDGQQKYTSENESSGSTDDCIDECYKSLNFGNTTDLRDLPSAADGPHATPASSVFAISSQLSQPPSVVSPERERQTLLLMLLAQVCSLHDATPRTFVVHVLALFERGILDNDSIRFLFELGLVPKTEETEHNAGDEILNYTHERVEEKISAWSNTTPEKFSIGGCCDPNSQAVVPYSPKTNRHPWSQCLVHLPSATPEIKNMESSVKLELENRQKEASAIRKHLERHESFHSSSKSSVDKASLGSSNLVFTSNDVTSNSESFGTTNDMNTSNQQTHLSTNMPASVSSWSVEHHPLSLSRYQREFHQISLLATGSFGSVYHAIHKLEHRPYAVKCVSFSTTGYYANTLALVVREVRCLAQLDHPNCVRYYTSWLEPSWMTGDQNLERDNLDSHPFLGETAINEYTKQSPMLLTDIERVVNGIQKADEIDHTVEKLEAILYGCSADEKNDGFDWTSTSKSPLHQPSIYQANDQSMYSINSNGDRDDSDVSEWTQELNAEETVGSYCEVKYSSSCKNVTDYCNTRESSPSIQSHNPQLIYTPQKESNDYHCLNNKIQLNGKVNRKQSCQKIKSLSLSSSLSYKYRISLYIQMQLCRPTTLADWIKQRNNSCLQFDAEEQQTRAPMAFRIFHQIVMGLAHVHAKGIIHRDLKPSNIFAGENGNWCIGDFGLSKMMSNSYSLGSPPNADEVILSRTFVNDIHTAGVGTASYAAPEQMSQTQYGPEVDIYALGMILLELFSNFTSEHERAKALHLCRHNGEIDPWLKNTYPEVSALVVACTQKNPRKRPTASNIQAASVFPMTGHCGQIFWELGSLKAELERKDSLILEQKEQLMEKDKMIQNLQQRLAEVEVNTKTTVNVTYNENAGNSSSEDDY